jgi:hypothetical protein
MQFELIEQRKNQATLTEEERKEFDEAFTALREHPGMAIKVTLQPDVKYNSYRNKLKRYADEKGAHVLFKKQRGSDNVFTFFIATEEQWKNRPVVGRQAGAAKGGRPKRVK